MIKNEMLGRVGHMLVAALLLCGGLASQVFADNASVASATQTESALFRAVMGGECSRRQAIIGRWGECQCYEFGWLDSALRCHYLQQTAPTPHSAGGSGGKSCPLFYAIRDGKEAAVTQLLAAGADVNAWHKNDTPLIAAILFGRVNIVKQLLATPGIDVNKTTRETADTPLHKAAWKGSRQIIPLLLAVPGIDVNAKNAAGDTPLKLAEKFGYPRCAEMIRAAGGKK